MSEKMVNNAIFAFISTIAVYYAPGANAGGLYIWEFGQPTQGASGAGAGALAQDASTSFLNPAGIMFLDDSEMMATGFLIGTEIKFSQDSSSSLLPPSVTDSEGNRPADNGGDAGSVIPAGAFFYARPVNDKWGWGLSVASISGAAMEFENRSDFAGRYWAEEVELLTIYLSPSLSYKVNDDFSIGFSLPVMFGSLNMDVAIPGPLASVPDGLAKIKDGNDIGATFSVSALWQATPRLRLGAMYLGELEISFDSDVEITLPPGELPGDIAASVDFTFPQTVRTWAAYELNERVTLLGTLAWEDWSAFDSLLISTSAGSGVLPRNWDDTWHIGVGLQISNGGPLTWYTGLAYDSDPTNPQERTIDMPIDEQWRLSGGFSKDRENGNSWGVVVTYADYGDAAIDNGGNRPVTSLPWTVKGKFSTNRIIFAGFNYGW